MAASAILLVLALGCNKTPVKVSVSPPTTTLMGKDASVTLKATVSDSKGLALPKIKVVWRSANEAVAIVDPAGKVTPKASGESRIIATAGKLTGEAKVTVLIVGAIQVAVPEIGLVGQAGTKIPLAVKVFDELNREIPNAPIIFSISDPKCATIDKAGTLTLLASGPVTLKASVGKKESSIRSEVLVQVPKFLNFKLTKSTMALKKDESARLEFQVFDEKGKPCKVPPVFASSDEKVATVDARGFVTGIGPGSAEITLTVGTDKRPVKVTVK
jgi:uncharacterized protein YjdB